MVLKMIILFAFNTIIGSEPDEKATQTFRELILFADARNDVSLKKQMKMLDGDAKGLAERDIKITVKIWNEGQRISYKKNNIPKCKFTIVLVGKDGGEKFRSEKVVTLQKLYDIIDAMPMRIYEMKKQ